MKTSPSIDLILNLTRPGRSVAMLGVGHGFFPCALGRSGAAPFHSEGDGTTPYGIWPLRCIFYRADRLPRPRSGLPVFPIRPDDGWCDAARDACYNQPVKLPFRASAEHLWREDHLYDLILVPGINDNPVITGRGSALFVHTARPGLLPTEGCIGLKRRDLVRLLPRLSPRSRLIISPGHERRK